MKCFNCGSENEENAGFCQRCGASLNSGHHSPADRLRLLLNDSLFLVLCILYSVSVGLSFISGGFSVIGILMIIFLWLFFSQRENEELSPDYLRCISGTIFASYVINWILWCSVAFCGMLLAVLSLTVDMTILWDRFHHEIEPYINNYLSGINIFKNSYLFLASILLIIFAIIGICVNIFGRRSIHRFVQSLYKNIGCAQIKLVKCETAWVWMVIFAILNAISAFSDLVRGSLSTFLAEGCMSAVFVVGSILVNKYFREFR